MKHDYLECGKVINKRGINGELKVDCYCDSPSSVFGAKTLYGDVNGETAYTVVSLKEYKGFLFVKIEGIDSAEKADKMRNKVLYVSRNDVKITENRNFVADLIGLDVKDAKKGCVYGKVKDVLNYGASDIYVISDGNKEYMLPAVEGVIVETDIEDCILVNPIPGIFDEAEEIR